MFPMRIIEQVYPVCFFLILRVIVMALGLGQSTGEGGTHLEQAVASPAFTAQLNVLPIPNE